MRSTELPRDDARTPRFHLAREQSPVVERPVASYVSRTGTARLRPLRWALGPAVAVTALGISAGGATVAEPARGLFPVAMASVATPPKAAGTVITVNRGIVRIERELEPRRWICRRAEACGAETSVGAAHEPAVTSGCAPPPRLHEGARSPARQRTWGS